MDKHTPAPWYWSDNVPDFPKNHCVIVDADGFTVVEPSPMSEADARLIAAAPDLLDALREAVEIIEGTGLDASVQREAIIKATGESK